MADTINSNVDGFDVNKNKIVAAESQSTANQSPDSKIVVKLRVSVDCGYSDFFVS